LLVYNIADKNSFEKCEQYFVDTIKKKCKNNIPVILIGNKTDLESEREISFKEGEILAFKNNFIFMETSCLKNENVSEAFKILIYITYKNLKLKEVDLNNLKCSKIISFKKSIIIPEFMKLKKYINY